MEGKEKCTLKTHEYTKFPINILTAVDGIEYNILIYF